jgi:hypothetical protein
MPIMRRLVCCDCGVACDVGQMRDERITFLTKLGAKQRLSLCRSWQTEAGAAQFHDPVRELARGPEHDPQLPKITLNIPEALPPGEPIAPDSPGSCSARPVLLMGD